MDADVDSTMDFSTMECFQQPAAPTRHPPQGDIGKGDTERPATMENLTLSTQKSKINKSMKTLKTPSLASKGNTIDTIHHALHRQQWEEIMRMNYVYGPLPP